MTYAISLSGTTVSIASPGPRGIGVPSGGTTGQALIKASDTNWDMTWGSGGGGLADLISDTTPQLGGNLDVNNFEIVSVSNQDIVINPNGTGNLVLNDLTWPSSDGSANQIIKTSGTGVLSFFTIGYADVLNAVGSGAVDCVTETDVTAGSITDVVALTNAQYGDITGGADPNTLYVITDGTTSIADSDDVTITAAATNDFLVYDGAWVDKTPAQVRAILDLEIGTDVQAYDVELAALAGLTSGTDALLYFTGSGTAATTTLSSFGRTLIDDADAATARATLGANDASNLTTGTLPAARLPAITDSYVGHIETPADGTYYLDPESAADRTITQLYLKWTDGGSGAGTLTLIVNDGVGDTTVDTVNLGTASNPYTSAVLSEALDSGDELRITIASLADITDLRFAVEYTQ